MEAGGGIDDAINLINSDAFQLISVVVSALSTLSYGLIAACNCLERRCNYCCCTLEQCQEPCQLALVASALSAVSTIATVLRWPPQIPAFIGLIALLVDKQANRAGRHNARLGCYDLGKKC